MTTEKLLTAADLVEWRAVVPAHASVFGSVDYARILQSHNGYEARLYLLDTDGAQIAYPFFLRPVLALPFAAQAVLGVWWDALTPDYTGPLQIDSAAHTVDFDLSARFTMFCQDNGIVTEFAHLHPWNWHPSLLEADLVSLDREIVYVDLTWPDERLWNDSFTYACRKNINRARREDVRIFPATTVDHVNEFYRIYTHTMQRNEASEKYFFSLDFFMAFFETMPENARFMMAEYRDQVVAGTLYLHDATDVYSYLGGADQEFQQIRSTNAIVYETIQWARDAGKRRLILGGGYRPDDGIFRFKSSFSPFRSRFHVYRRIHLPYEYDRLCRAWSSYYHCDPLLNDYFPAYRSQPVLTSAI